LRGSSRTALPVNFTYSKVTKFGGQLVSLAGGVRG
jgi:hypothetical protein